MFILNASGDSKVDDHTVQRSTLVLRLRDGIGALARILKTIENFKGTVVHVESRPSKQEGIQYDVLVKVDLTRQALLLLIRALRQSSALGGVSLLSDNNVNVKGVCAVLNINEPMRFKFAFD